MYKYADYHIPLREFDYRRIPVNHVDPMNEEDRTAFNNFIDEVATLTPPTPFIRTNKGGGIAKNWLNFVGNHWSIDTARTGEVRLTMHLEGKGWAIFSIVGVKQNTSEKKKWFDILKDLMKEVPQVEEQYLSTDLKENEKWHIEAKRFYNRYLAGTGESFFGIPATANDTIGKNLEHVYSLDFHKAFPTMLSLIIPEATDWRDKVVSGSIDKIDAVCAIGCMTSNKLIYHGLPSRGLAKLRYEILSKLCIMINELAELIEAAGGRVINYRTDSIKFIWTKGRLNLPHLPGEGIYWDYEWKNYTYRQFSTGKYEYSPNADHSNPHIVMNGRTTLDKFKPREQWTWDDLASPDLKVINWSWSPADYHIIISEDITTEHTIL